MSCPNISGRVEADETWIGGLDKNRHANKRQGRKWRDHRIPVAGVFDEQTKKVSAQVIERVDGPTLIRFVENKTRRLTTVYTDENPAYRDLIRHYTVNHSAGQYVHEMVTTNGIESFWAVLKRGYHGTFHWFSRKHAQRYINEFCGRQNWRSMDTLEMLEAAVLGMVGKRLPYAALTGHA